MSDLLVTNESLVLEARSKYPYMAANMPDNALRLARVGLHDRIHIIYGDETCCGIEHLPKNKVLGVTYYYYAECHKFDICLKCLATYWYRWIR